jgi:hypothetical protein
MRAPDPHPSPATGHDSVAGRLYGHFWTLWPFLRHQLGPPRLPPSQPFRARVPDSTYGSVQLTGCVHEPAGATQALVLVHGLGGSAESHYVVEATAAAAAHGMATLRLNLRGADRHGEDFYHAGLTADLDAAVASPALARYDRVAVLGFSLGGHLALKYASEAPDPRLTGIAAICPPVDLAAGARAIDAPARILYRRHILHGLVEIYEQVAKKRPVPVPVSRARAVGTIREWDELIVAPRHGFASAEDYWRQASVAPRLGAIACPALVVAARHDPMVLAGDVAPALARAPRVTSVWLDRGGHVGFPRHADLGLERTEEACAPDSVAAQVVGFLAALPGPAS